MSQNLTVWSCGKSVLCSVFCEAKHRNSRMLKHNSVFCVPFCANGAQKVTRVFKKKPILQLLNDMKNYKNVFTDYY